MAVRIAAGIDVGGPKKGFHGVALRDGAYWRKFATQDAAEMAAWCEQEVGAQAVGVDAPCRWSETGRMRPCERALARELISCFATPSMEAAQSNPFYAWMKNGAALFRYLEQDYALFDGQPLRKGARVCFETFPQAIACVLAGARVSAKEKSTVRRALLIQAGVAVEALRNIDTVDAALCALSAHHVLLGHYRAFGEAQSGLIVVPAPVPALVPTALPAVAPALS